MPSERSRGEGGPTPRLEGIKSRLAEHEGCGSPVDTVRNGAHAERGLQVFFPRTLNNITSPGPEAPGCSESLRASEVRR